MGTLHHLSALDQNPRRQPDDAVADLEVPDWEAFTAARDRFFDRLRVAAEFYRGGEPTLHELADDEADPDTALP